jgi:transcription elongation factor Elf1
MEQTIAADRKPFHVRCIRCQTRGCGNDLTARSIHKYEGYNICEKCHEAIFRERVYGPGQGMESMEDRRKREEEERLARERSDKAKAERRCPECGNKTFGEDAEMLAPDLYYHKGCIKCVECSRVPESDSPIVMAPRDTENMFADEILEPYCKFCYAKKFKTSAIRIAEIVEIAPEFGISL